MNLDASEDGQMIGMEDSFVNNEDLGRKREKRSRKNVKGKGFSRCLKKFDGKKCKNGDDCGPYGSCQRFPDFEDYSMGEPVLV